uniref:PH domain-containing protein n=1 Tax=Romanomermis culicivorax TaxID=13658 RepID=A0A915HUX2_ROMCU
MDKWVKAVQMLLALSSPLSQHITLPPGKRELWFICKHSYLCIINDQSDCGLCFYNIAVTSVNHPVCPPSPFLDQISQASTRHRQCRYVINFNLAYNAIAE